MKDIVKDGGLHNPWSRHDASEVDEYDPDLSAVAQAAGLKRPIEERLGAQSIARFRLWDSCRMGRTPTDHPTVKIPGRCVPGGKLNCGVPGFEARCLTVSGASWDRCSLRCRNPQKERAILRAPENQPATRRPPPFRTDSRR